MKEKLKRFQWALLAVLVFCLGGCKDDDAVDATSVPFDPTQPVVITDFTPKEGGAYQRLLIYGENFGTDKSQVKVTIGGVDAVVINVKSTYIYCFVPSGAFDGNIEVTVGEGDNAVTAAASTPFTYEKKMVVGTLCGYRNDNDNQGWRNGPFEGPDNVRACGFANPGFMAVDPLNKNHIYICYDGHKQIQLIDLERQWVSDAMDINVIPTNRIRSICFSKAVPGYCEEGDYMFIAVDDNGQGNTSPSVYIAQRNPATGVFDNGSDVQLIAAYRQCNGATVHPINGDLYFNSYELGQVWRLDLKKYFDVINAGRNWTPNVVDHPELFDYLFTIADPNWEFQIYFHPTGKYAYISVINNHYIMRSDFNEETQRLVTPYVFAGGYKQSGYSDDVGASARFNNQRQGVFIYNPDYAGSEDEYDYYFCDRLNFCVRKLTPEGIASTYAGRGSTSALGDGNQWGTDDGDLRETARFRDICAIVYYPEENIFYIQDEVGRTIRTISMEEDPSETVVDEGGDTTGETGSGDESTEVSNE